MKRPTFFLSSTIYDFQDLRSALKFYLERQGCKVLASEYNDFEKKLDSHSYEECLKSIHKADYFILLIGQRVGGWYSLSDRISITQREYREAYELQKSGKLKLFCFVRASMWQVKEDRSELAKYLSTINIEEEHKKSIVNYPSKFAREAEFLSSFIDEIGRNQETKSALRGKGEFPTGNWVHVFTGFKDIVDALEGHLFISTPMEELSVRRLLRLELRGYLKRCLPKISEQKVISPRYSIEAFHKKYKIKFGNDTSPQVELESQEFMKLIFLLLMAPVKLHPVVLPQVLVTPTFLSYDVGSDGYVETPCYRALQLLQDEIRQVVSKDFSDIKEDFFKKQSSMSTPKGSIVRVDRLKLILLLHFFDRWANVVALTISILKYLDGEDFQMPRLRPSSPIEGMQEEIDEEVVTDEDVDAFLLRE